MLFIFYKGYKMQYYIENNIVLWKNLYIIRLNQISHFISKASKLLNFIYMIYIFMYMTSVTCC